MGSAAGVGTRARVATPSLSGFARCVKHGQPRRAPPKSILSMRVVTAARKA